MAVDSPEPSLPFRGQRRWLLLISLAAFACLLGYAVLARLSHGDAVKTTAAASSPDKTSEQDSFYATRFEKQPSVAAMTAIGRQLFFDPQLSASGRQSCASCHDPQHAYGPPNGLAVQPGGLDMQAHGSRAAPSLRYLQSVPAFAEHFYDSDGDDSIDQGPAGGRTWDGRVSSAHEQARLPLFSPAEMANQSAEDIVARVRQAAYAPQLREAYGDHVFDDAKLAFDAVLMSLEVFQQDPREFYPYSSKYDAWLRGQVQLTAREQRGLAVFNDPARGNCASCHISGIKNGAFPAFTDFGHIAVGAPRNRQIPANRDPRYFDLGLCGPLRTDLKDHPEYCGRFRTPTLRNVALRRSFFHNGVFHTLDEVLRFYAQRDTHPQRWYPRRPDGSVNTFDDLPAQYHANINREPPFGGQPGGKPSMSAAEMADLIVFLDTLTDGYRR